MLWVPCSSLSSLPPVSSWHSWPDPDLTPVSVECPRPASILRSLSRAMVLRLCVHQNLLEGWLRQTVTCPSPWFWASDTFSGAADGPGTALWDPLLQPISWFTSHLLQVTDPLAPPHLPWPSYLKSQPFSSIPFPLYLSLYNKNNLSIMFHICV